MERAEVLDALDNESRSLASATATLSEADFATPTRCEPWSVAELLAHVLVACRRLPDMLATPPPTRPDASALEYFRRDRHGGDLDVERVGAAREVAGGFGDRHDLVAAITAATDEMIRLTRAEPAGRLVLTRWNDAMRLDDYLATRVVELAVHGLDIAAALGAPRWTSSAASHLTVSVVTERMDRRQREETGWDDFTLIGKTTGRLRLTRREAALGITASLLWPQFPPSGYRATTS